jgi:glycosyltransferase involved in cell wall biosynthesis
MIVMLCAAVPSSRSGYGTRSLMIAAALATVDGVRIIVTADGETSAASILELPNGHAAVVEHVGRGQMTARLSTLRPDLLVAAETALAPAALAAGGTVVVVLHNVESELWREAASNASGQERADALHRAKLHRLIERKVVSRAAQVWAVSDSDAATMASLLGDGDPGGRVVVVPNVVRDPDRDRVRTPEVGHGVFFGSLWWKPNEDAVRDLASLSRRLAGRGVRHVFTVAGQGATVELRRSVEQVGQVEPVGKLELVGFVPDLEALLDRSACAVLPVRSGGGSMVKLIEAMRLGVPVLTTPQGARGISGLTHGTHLQVVPLGPAFDDTCVDMLNRPGDYEAMAKRGQDFVAERLSLTALEASVRNLIGTLRSVVPSAVDSTS